MSRFFTGPGVGCEERAARFAAAEGELGGPAVGDFKGIPSGKEPFILKKNN